ncbi:MAG: DNA2/NAM7 family helicase [Rhodothermaceae bacterium]|nr:DNA2/NAM7 family helicase [Rhodothermaceae bacterium]
MTKRTGKKQVTSLLSACLEALDAEIETVRRRPSEDVLYGGQKEKGGGEHYRYRFASTNNSLKYAEEITAELGGTAYVGVLLEFDEKEVTLGFDHNFGPSVTELNIRWENDFVLRRLQEKLHRLSSNEEDYRDSILRLLNPASSYETEANGKADTVVTYDRDGESNGTEAPFADPVIATEELKAGGLNDRQAAAVNMAVSQPATFIWGPPGTGKTSTLGYIMASLLEHGQRVLFVSNTNRAVDVGMLSVLDALDSLGRTSETNHVTRFGEMVLENRQLQAIAFDQQLESFFGADRDRKVQMLPAEEEYHRLIRETEKLMTDGEAVPRVLRLRIRQLKKELDEAGPEMQTDPEGGRSREMVMINLLAGMKLIGTTLARVCTSDLIDMQQFDAVVIDEASMAGLPYALVMAAKAQNHLVVTGDPMQLPPIALTDDYRHKELLEQDIFTWVSKATEPGDLFRWHDENPGFTCFFDTQYRLNSDLAAIISDVFYEGRLKTGKVQKKGRNRKNSVRIINTEHQNPFITSQGEKGFRPLNELHQQIVVDEVHRLVVAEGVLPLEIGIIVPFRSVVWDYRRQLNARNMADVEVGTIHTFQGREKQVIIFDTVMSGQSQFGKMRHFSVRPFDEDKNGLSVPRLLNVAFSRSKDQLVLVADFNHMRKIYRNKFLGRLIGRLVGEAPAPS